MYLLLLAGFSNYNNRTIRKTTNPDLYSSLAESYWYITKDNQLLDINFKPNDGVTTTQVINSSLYSEFGHEPDYLIAFENADTSSPSIVSRWFVMEIRQNRGGQYELTLRRDLIADYYEELKTADIFVERGICSDSDPLILNDEGMILNKIKKSEYLLKDKTRTAWIVGYMNSPANAIHVEKSIAAPKQFLTISQLASQTGIPEATLNKLFNGQQVQTMVGYWSFISRYDIFRSALSIAPHEARIEGYINQECTQEMGYSTAAQRLDRMFVGQLVNPLSNSDAVAWKTISNGLLAQSPSDLKAAFTAETGAESDWITSDQYYALMSVGKVIQYDGDFYEFSLERSEPELLYPPKKLVSANSTFAAALTAASNPTELTIINKFPVDAEFRVAARFAKLTLNKTLWSATSMAVDIGGPSRATLKDKPYQMFCMPYDDLLVDYMYDPGGGDDPYIITEPSFKEYTRAVAGSLQLMSSNLVYDLQLLPYCPFRSAIKAGNKITLEGLTESVDYDWIISDPNGAKAHAGIILYPETDSATFSITKTYVVDTNKKFDSNAKMLRLCSPNYQGSFDFNAAKNDGITNFVVNFTYKPFSPFLRVAPNFKGIYGSEFNDQRGLLCGGNYSLTNMEDHWFTYQLNNKNYQNIFNREIQTLDLSQSLQMRDAIIGASVGTLQGGVTGAQTGAMAGGGWAAAAGAVLGAGVSGIGGAIDVNTLARLQKDQRALQVDKFNYALGNIKALPNTLTKIDSFDISSKIFPFVEEYGPTEEEKALFLERMRLQSYTLMRIEKLGNQMTEDDPTDISALHYVKGQLIRTNNEDLRVDSHQWDEIYAELSKGVYI